MRPINIADLNNAKQDVDHIAEIATSTAATATDRLGNTKPTMRGAVNSLAAFNARGAFVAGRAYAIKDVYTSGGIAYVALVAHTSAASATTDLAAGKVAVHQGATREDLATSGGSAMIGHGTRTLVDKFNEVVSVKDAPFNAKGDGATDDTAAIQAALNAAVTVFFPAGTYVIGRLVLKKQGQVLRGAGSDATVLLCTSGAAITNYAGADTDPVGADWVGGLTIESLALKGGFNHSDVFAAPTNSWALASGRGKTFATSGLNIGLRLKRCYPYTLRNIKISNFHRGVHAAGAALASWSNFQVADCQYGMYGENGASWGDAVWQITTHHWRDGRFRNCWIGIGGTDFVQCQVYKRTVDFEPCNSGIAITNGGENTWGGYFELCYEGIYRNGGSMGHDIIEDPFFGGSPGAFWGNGYSILLDSGIGAYGKVTLRNGGASVTGGGIGVLGGRLIQSERERTSTTVYLSPAIVPAGGYAATNLGWAKVANADDIAGLFDVAQPTRLTIPPSLNGARVKLRANLGIDGDAMANDIRVEFRKNGAAFPGTGQYAAVFAYGKTLSIESAAITVSAGDYFTVTVIQNLPRNIPTGNHAWFSVDVIA